MSALLLVLNLCRVFAQTTINGGAVSGTWTKANSPYFITAAIMVANGTSLTIEPGVTVKFLGSYKFLNMGQITAVGNLNDSIVFTAQDTTTGWRGIRFEHTNVANDSSRFKYCRIEWGNVSGLTSIDAEGGAFLLLGFHKVLVSNCLIAHCRAQQAGAIRGAGAARICNNLFTFNSASSIGAVSCETYGGNPLMVYNNRFVRNTAIGSYGGALASWDNALIYNNTFLENTSLANDYAGGAIYCGSGCSAIINNNKFFSNRSLNGSGGAIFMYSGNPTIYNNLICNNSAKSGGGIHCESGGTIYNNTIANNSANKAGAINFVGSSPTVRNCILWGNRSLGNNSQVFLNDDASDPNFYYCDIEGGQAAFGLNSNIFYLGTYNNNINSNPKFLNPTAGTNTTLSNSGTDWSLPASSPCYDAGDPVGTYPAYDITMGPRIINNIIDIGAYENSLTNVIFESGRTLNSGIYPNPGSGRFSLIAHNATPIKFEVFNTIGTLVFESVTVPNIDSTDFDISELGPGIYFVKTERQVVYKVVLAK